MFEVTLVTQNPFLTRIDYREVQNVFTLNSLDIAYEYDSYKNHKNHV